MFRNIEVSSLEDKAGTRMMVQLGQSRRVAERVVRFMNLFSLDKEGMVSKAQFSQVLRASYYLLLGQLGEEQLLHLVTQDLETVGDYVSGQQMGEWLIELALMFLQAVCEEKALSFLDYVFHRITEKIDVCDHDKKSPYVMEVTMDQVADSTFLFQEKKVYPPQEQQSIYEYRLTDQVIQSGASVETVICNRFNGDTVHSILDIPIHYTETTQVDFSLWVDKSFCARVVNNQVVMSA